MDLLARRDVDDREGDRQVGHLAAIASDVEADPIILRVDAGLDSVVVSGEPLEEVDLVSISIAGSDDHRDAGVDKVLEELDHITLTVVGSHLRAEAQIDDGGLATLGDIV